MHHHVNLLGCAWAQQRLMATKCAGSCMVKGHIGASTEADGHLHCQKRVAGVSDANQRAAVGDVRLGRCAMLAPLEKLEFIVQVSGLQKGAEAESELLARAPADPRYRLTRLLLANRQILTGFLSNSSFEFHRCNTRYVNQHERTTIDVPQSCRGSGIKPKIWTTRMWTKGTQRNRGSKLH